MNTATFRAELERDGYTSIETRSAEAGIFSPAHSHPCDVRALILEGELTLHCAGDARTYRPGEVVELAAGCEHAEENGPDGYRYLVGRRMRPG